MFNSDAKQDEFVANLLNFNQKGYYVDIGSCHSIQSNNSYYFDFIGWSGICVEIESQYNEGYKYRKNCKYLNCDATKIDYESLFIESQLPKIIDYVSLDVDTLNIDVLKKLPLDVYDIKVLTIEHDFYLHGDKYRSQQREILLNSGYHLLCADVFVQQSGFYKENCSFEDWWINPKYFDNQVHNLFCNSEYPSEIIKKFKTNGNT